MHGCLTYPVNMTPFCERNDARLMCARRNHPQKWPSPKPSWARGVGVKHRGDHALKIWTLPLTHKGWLVTLRVPPLPEGLSIDCVSYWAQKRPLTLQTLETAPQNLALPRKEGVEKPECERPTRHRTTSGQYAPKYSILASSL